MSIGPQLSDFLGKWSLRRDIDDRAAGARLRFAGIAEFTPRGQGLAYAERGLLEVPGQPPMQAERHYFWRAEPPGIAVTFADGTPFHAIAPELRPEARHECGADSYAVRYDFSRWPDWRAVWRVTGPRKAYVMISRYRRA